MALEDQARTLENAITLLRERGRAQSATQRAGGPVCAWLAICLVLPFPAHLTELYARLTAKVGQSFIPWQDITEDDEMVYRLFTDVATDIREEARELAGKKYQQ